MIEQVDYILFAFNILVYGFCFTTFISYFLSLIKSEKLKAFNSIFFSCSIKTIRVIAILYFVYYLYDFIKFYSGKAIILFTERATGPYRLMYWFMLFRIFIFCALFQLFWIKRFQKKSVLNFILIITIFIIIFFNGANLERYVIMLTSWHRDYAPNSFYIDVLGVSLYKLLIIMFVERTLIFIGLVFLVRYISLKIKR